MGTELITSVREHCEIYHERGDAGDKYVMDRHKH